MACLFYTKTLHKLQNEYIHKICIINKAHYSKKVIIISNSLLKIKIIGFVLK